MNKFLPPLWLQLIAIIYTMKISKLLIYINLNYFTWKNYLAFFGGNGCIPVYKFGEHTSQSLNSQREGSDIKQEHICHIASQYTPLDSCSNSHSFIWVNRFTGGPTKQFLYCLLNL